MTIKLAPEIEEKINKLNANDDDIAYGTALREGATLQRKNDRKEHKKEIEDFYNYFVLNYICYDDLSLFEKRFNKYLKINEKRKKK